MRTTTVVEGLQLVRFDLGNRRWNIMSETLLRELERLGVARGILVDMARREQILEVRCEMPHCYHHKGRKAFDPRSQRPPSNWELTADHYPRLKMHGGRLTLDNVRLAHRLCNRVDYGWRIKIGPLLTNGMSLAVIADRLEKQSVPRPHGSPRWTPALVRKVFVS
jgi:hypothetical protein